MNEKKLYTFGAIFFSLLFFPWQYIVLFRLPAQALAMSSPWLAIGLIFLIFRERKYKIIWLLLLIYITPMSYFAMQKEAVWWDIIDISAGGAESYAMELDFFRFTYFTVVPPIVITILISIWGNIRLGSKSDNQVIGKGK